jgi:uncharacterized membrane protein
MASQDHSEPTERRIVATTFKWGLSISSAAMLGGMILGWVTGETATGSIDFTRLGDLSVAQTSMAIGIAVLAVMPVVNVVALVGLWTRHRQFRLAAVGLTVITTLVLAVILGRG